MKDAAPAIPADKDATSLGRFRALNGMGCPVSELTMDVLAMTGALHKAPNIK